jgi:protein phosphatase
MELRWGSATDVGLVRSDNQDSFLTNDRVLAVADGMGGHRGGQIASQVAIETLGISYTEPTVDGLREAAEVANHAVFAKASDNPELRGMGTTLVAIARVDGDGDRQVVGWVNIGDSRLYLFRDGDLEQLSEDHSLVEEMVRDGRIAPEDARQHPQRNILTRALGIDPNPSVDSDIVDPYVGDRFLLCSDGLFNEVDEARIAATLRRLDDPDDAAKELVRLALEGGGRDNVTVVIGDVIDDDGVSAAASGAIGAGTAEGHADGGTAVVPKVEPPGGATFEPEKLTRKQRRAQKERPRILTFRLLLFFVLLLLVIGGAMLAVVHQAHSGYTVKLVDGRVLVYEGNGDKVLWYTPTVKDTIDGIDVAPQDKSALLSGVHFGSLEAARSYIDHTIRTDAANASAAARSTTTTSTTTTLTTTSTTVVTTTAPVN